MNKVVTVKRRMGRHGSKRRLKGKRRRRRGEGILGGGGEKGRVGERLGGVRRDDGAEVKEEDKDGVEGLEEKPSQVGRGGGGDR